MFTLNWRRFRLRNIFNRPTSIQTPLSEPQNIPTHLNDDNPKSDIPIDVVTAAADHQAAPRSNHERQLSSDGLCELCQQNDLKEFFLDEPDRHGYRPKKDTPTKPLSIVIGSLHYMTQNVENCVSCRLIVKAIQSSWTRMPLRPILQLFRENPPLNGYLESVEGTTTELPVRSIQISVVAGENRVFKATGSGETCEWLYVAELRLLADDAPKLGLQTFGHARKVGPVCDMSLMKLWYEQCCSGHLETCSIPRLAGARTSDSISVSSRLPKNFRVIDVRNMRVILARDDCKYLALSYVWGQTSKIIATKSTTEKWEKPGSLSTLPLPKVVLDAIELTKELEEDFLWVDAFCIAQDSDDKKEQIHQMDMIYGLASLVIIAAAGSTAEVGLQGYHKSPRTSSFQHIETVRGIQIAISSPPLDYILKSSKWNSRGWTFQEGMLARRALIFTPYQVYFICNSTSYCEDLDLEIAKPHTPFVLLFEQCSASTFRHYLPNRYMSLSINSGFSDYRRAITEYSHRELTAESDVLPAISGILNNLHRASRNRFICGMSVGLLHDAIFWVPAGTEPLRRRPPLAEFGNLPYPTWSWAAWKGGVKYDKWPSAPEADIKKWTVVSADGHGVVLGDLGAPLTELQDDHIIQHTGNVYFTDRDNIMDPEKERKRQGTGGLPHNILTPCLLHFSAEVAVLRVVTGILDDIASPMETLVDSDGRWIGFVLFDSPRPMMERMLNNFKPYIFVAIATTTMSLDMKRIDGFSYEMDLEWLNVLAVERQDLVSQRLGVGQVRKSAWQKERQGPLGVLLG